MPLKSCGSQIHWLLSDMGKTLDGSLRKQFDEREREFFLHLGWENASRLYKSSKIRVRLNGFLMGYVNTMDNRSLVFKLKC